MSFNASFRTDVPSTAVHYRSSWAQAWTSLPYAYVDSVSYSIGGGFGQARILYKYGRIMQPGATSYATFSKINIDRYYVRITYTPPGGSVTYWYGVVISATDETIGGDAGDQTITAVTLDWLLTQSQVSTGVVKNGSGYVEIQRPISFNLGPGGTANSAAISVANRAAVGVFDGGTEYPVFAEDLDTYNTTEWSGYDIIKYLLYWASPSRGTNGPDWSVSTVSYSHLNWFHPLTHTDGRTVHDILNSVVDQRRGLAWYLDASESGCVVRVVSYSPSAIVIDDDNTIPANSAVTLSVDDEVQVARVSTITDSQQRYGQVRVVGARRGACFTVGPEDGTVVQGWTSSQEVAYLAGDPNATGTELS